MMDVEPCLLATWNNGHVQKMSLSKGRGVITVSGRKYYKRGPSGFGPDDNILGVLLIITTLKEKFPRRRRF